jgi:TonB family protein
LIGVGLLLVIGAFAFSYLRGRSEIKAGDTSIAATETAASQQPRKEVVVSGKDDGVAVRSAAPAESSISGKGEHSTSKSKGSPNVTVATEVAQGDGLVPLPGDESLSQPVPLPLPSSAPRPLTFEDAEEHPPDVPTQPLEFSSALNLLAATASANSSLKPSLAQQPRPAILIARDVKPTQFVQPQYPGFARTAHIEGTVLLKATVSPSGKVSEVEVVKGPPALANAAVQAVKKWKYPAAQDSSPAEQRDFAITIKFSLN